jgi:lon-related putative ATP-dependent protease
MAQKLKPQDLRRRCDPEIFDYNTTEEVEPLAEIIGQERAVKALELGLGIKDFRYNIYVAGGPGTGKMSTVRAFLERVSAKEEQPPDICYVYNFDDPYSPRYLLLEPGKGLKFKNDMKKLIERLKADIPTAFKSEEYQERKGKIDEEFNNQKNKLFIQLEAKAKEKGFLLEMTPIGINAIPIVEGKPISKDVYGKLEESQRKAIESAHEEVRNMIQETLIEARAVEEKRAKKLEELNHEVASFSVGPRIAHLQIEYGTDEKVNRFLEDVKADILANLNDFLKENKTESVEQLRALDTFRKYDVNVIVDNSNTEGAPVIVEENATYPNLFGKVERRAQFGVMIADFTMIRAGSLHQANGGYLVLNADNLFKYPVSWEGLKVALKRGQIQIEDPAQAIGIAPSEGLKPQPLPLNVKLIIVGNQEMYHLLQAYDEDFQEFFKIKSDFDSQMDWNEENIRKFGPFICARCKERKGLKPFDRSGVARVVEYAAELTGDKRKLSARFSDIMVIIREASYWAEVEGSPYVKEEHVEKAIEEKVYRSNLIEEKIQEMIERGDILVETEGEKVGQVNGLSVVTLGDFSFGRPSKITANVYTGKEGVVDIEREAKLSGRIHTKGLLILKGWLGEKFAHNKPLSLSASLTFEQSYSMIDGDSASSTELYALISALSGVPLKQGIAVTGSVNQKGEVQPIGGVNEKIRGFYKTCKLKGLTGEQGIIIPKQNVDNLMLPKEIIEAVEKGKFHLWAVQTIDEGIEILTGQKAGKRLENGEFEKGTIYYKVDQRLREIQEQLSKAEAGKEEKET